MMLKTAGNHIIDCKKTLDRTIFKKRSNDKNKLQENISLGKGEIDTEDGMRECICYLLLHNEPHQNVVA